MEICFQVVTVNRRELGALIQVKTGLAGEATRRKEIKRVFKFWSKFLFVITSSSISVHAFERKKQFVFFAGAKKTKIVYIEALVNTIY